MTISVNLQRSMLYLPLLVFDWKNPDLDPVQSGCPANLIFIEIQIIAVRSFIMNYNLVLINYLELINWVPVCKEFGGYSLPFSVEVTEILFIDIPGKVNCKPKKALFNFPLGNQNEAKILNDKLALMNRVQESL